MGLDYDDDDDDDEVEVMMITDHGLFARSLREAACTSVAKGTVDVRCLDEYMTLQQVSSIIEDYIEGVDEESGNPVMSEEAYLELVRDVSSSFLGACLAKLAAADLVETAWDEERGQQVFWRKERGG